MVGMPRIEGITTVFIDAFRRTESEAASVPDRP